MFHFLYENVTLICFDSFVCCSTNGINMPSSQHFRTYQGLPKQGPDCKIWEAACATTATPTFFKAIKITGSDGAGQDYVSAGQGFNNPTKEVRDEAIELFQPNRRIGVFVSIGTGYPDPSQSLPQWTLPRQLVKALRTIAIDCEQTAKDMAKEYGDNSFYFRFNIPHDTYASFLDEGKDATQVTAHTKAYLESSDVSLMINRVVDSLCSLS